MHVVSFAVWYEMIQAKARRHLCACIWRALYEHSIFSALVWLAPDAEATLERKSETSPVWCGHKDVLHLNKCNPFQEKKETEAAVVNGVANPCPAPALKALNIFNTLIWKNVSRVNALTLTPLIYIYIYSAVKWLIASKIKIFVYIICVYRVYLLCIYKYTHSCNIFKKNMLR